MSNDKELKIEFAPGCFNSFEGTQEELDELVAEIQKMFEGKSKEELEAMARPLSDEDFADLPEDVQVQLIQSIDGFESEDHDPTKKLH